MNRLRRSRIAPPAVPAGPPRLLRRSLCGAVVVVALVAHALLAQEGIRRGMIKRVDPDRGVITITTEGEDRDFTVTETTQIKDVPGRPVEEGLKDRAFRQGVPVM